METKEEQGIGVKAEQEGAPSGAAASPASSEVPSKAAAAAPKRPVVPRLNLQPSLQQAEADRRAEEQSSQSVKQQAAPAQPAVEQPDEEERAIQVELDDKAIPGKFYVMEWHGKQWPFKAPANAVPGMTVTVMISVPREEAALGSAASGKKYPEPRLLSRVMGLGTLHGERRHPANGHVGVARGAGRFRQSPPLARRNAGGGHEESAEPGGIIRPRRADDAQLSAARRWASVGSLPDRPLGGPSLRLSCQTGPRHLRQWRATLTRPLKEMP